MADPDDPGPPADDPGGPDPADAFALLGNATRLAIVTALHDLSPETPVSFSTLYERVDIDDSGKFNYHQQELVPHFVAKTDEGYELTAAGKRIARAVAAGTYTDTPRLDPFPVEGACYDCGAEALDAAYEGEKFRVECRSCGGEVLDVSAPPSLVRGRDPEAAVDAFDQWSRTQVRQAVRGMCPDCGGAVERTVSERPRPAIPFDVFAQFECTVCGHVALTSFGGVAAQHPVVRSFHRRRSASLRDRHYWLIDQFVTDESLEVVSRDPWRIAVTFTADGDRCRVVIDGDLEVVETTIVPERRRGEGS